MTPDIGKHLEFVQNAIERMAHNSFMVKSWTVALTTGLFTLAAKEVDAVYVFIAIYPALALWGLDAYYLRQEKLFRELYKDVVEHGHDQMQPFVMSTAPYSKNMESWWMVLISPTIIALHGIIFAAILTFAVILSR